MKRGVLLFLMNILLLSSCKNAYETLMEEKEEQGFKIILSDPTGFYFADNNGIYYYDRNIDRESIIYKEGLTNFKFYFLKLFLSDDNTLFVGRIEMKPTLLNKSEVIKKYVKESFVGKAKKGIKLLGGDGFYYTNDYSLPDYGLDNDFLKFNNYLVTPIDSSCIEVTWLGGSSDSYRAHFGDQNVIVDLEFYLSQLPDNLKPKLDESILRKALYTNNIDGYKNKLGRFYYPVTLNGKGEISQPDDIKSGV